MVALVTSSYTPDIDGDEFFDDISNEVSGAGYTSGGAELENPVVSQDNTDDEGVLDGDDVQWSGASLTARAAVIYKDTGTPSTSRLIGYVDFGSDKTATGGAFDLAWNAEGVLNLN